MTHLKYLISGAAALALAACGSNGPSETSESAATASQTEAVSSSLDDITITPGPGPALWKVSDEDTDIYLFGTVHVLPPALNWRTPVVDAALDEADIFYFEADVDGNEQQMAMLVA